jgi:IMP dehydrogenase
VQVQKVVKDLRSRSYGKYLYLVAGNVGSSETFKWLEEQGVDAIRVGIAGGNVCETRSETGVFAPAISAIFDAAKVRKSAKIIADGGIRTPSDFCKALASGADLVMAGSIFAGTDESPGKVILVDGKKFKILRGSASYSTQESVGKEPIYVEGDETLVPYRGSVKKVIDRFKNGLLSSMSYCNARTLEEYRANTTLVQVR